MRKRLIALFVCGILSIGIPYAIAEPDRETRGAIADIVKYEKTVCRTNVR